VALVASFEAALLMAVSLPPDNAVRAAALRLVGSPRMSGPLEALAARSLRTIVALGDSLTADRRSWAEILRQALHLIRAGELVNLGVPGDTTVHLIGRFADVAACDPDLLVVMVGTNDARRHGAAAARMLVPDRETESNLILLNTLAREQTDARVVFITPPPIIERKIERAPELRREPVSWLEADVDRKAAIAAALDAEVVDSRVALQPPLDRLLLADGLHLSLRGHERLARWLVGALSSPRPAP
jgi:lysophospholipase L1-like esterase